MVPQRCELVHLPQFPAPGLEPVSLPRPLAQPFQRAPVPVGELNRGGCATGGLG